MYEYHSGRLDEFYKPCLLTLSDLYAILHATALYFMFDLGFQIQRRRMLCMDPNLNLRHLEYNICPCNKDMCKFFEDNGLIDPVLRQLHRQSGDQTQTTRRKMFPCQNRLYGNEQLYNHMVQKKECYLHYLFWLYLEITYGDITKDFYSNKKRKLTFYILIVFNTRLTNFLLPI